MGILQVGILGVLGTLLALYLKQNKSEYAVLVGLAVSLVIFFCMLDRLKALVEILREIAAFIRLDNEYIATLLKMLGVTYVAEFAGNICTDAGYSTIASQIGIFAKLTILALSMPILLVLLETIQAFLS